MQSPDNYNDFGGKKRKIKHGNSPLLQNEGLLILVAHFWNANLISCYCCLWWIWAKMIQTLHPSKTSSSREQTSKNQQDCFLLLPPLWECKLPRKRDAAARFPLRFGRPHGNSNKLGCGCRERAGGLYAIAAGLPPTRSTWMAGCRSAQCWNVRATPDLNESKQQTLKGIFSALLCHNHWKVYETNPCLSLKTVFANAFCWI